MDVQIIAVYCRCDDLLKAMHHREDPQSHMSDAEVMTVAIVAALYLILLAYSTNLLPGGNLS